MCYDAIETNVSLPKLTPCESADPQEEVIKKKTVTSAKNTPDRFKKLNDLWNKELSAASKFS